MDSRGRRFLLSYALVAGVVGCRRESGQAESGLPMVTIEVLCDDTTTLEVRGDRKLDADLCGEAWDGLDVEAIGKKLLLHARPGRELWLRRARDRAFIEVREQGRVSEVIDRVLAIEPRDLARDARRPGQLTIVVGGTATALSAAELRKRYIEKGKRNAPFSLCRILDDIGGGSATGTARVFGEAPEPVLVERSKCTTRGYVLKLSGSGQIRLRATSDGARLLTDVTRIEI